MSTVPGEVHCTSSDERAGLIAYHYGYTSHRFWPCTRGSTTRSEPFRTGMNWSECCPEEASVRIDLPRKRLEVAEHRYLARFTSGATNCGSVSQGNMIQVSCETSVMKSSTVVRPAGFA